MIYRYIQKQIEEQITHFPIILLTGPRQTGKSTCLYHHFAGDRYAYVSLDDSLELALAKSDPRSFLQLHPFPLIIDEVQKAPMLFPEIEAIVNCSRPERGNRESNGMFILSGSQRSILLDQAKESLSGRVCILDMNNLSVNEIYGLENNGCFHADLMECSSRSKRYTLSETEAFQRIVRGFFPVLYDDPGIASSSFYSSYFSTYMQKDLKEILSVSDEVRFVNFIRLLASNTGEELIYENYSKQIGASANTIRSWVSALVRTGIIYLVQPYNEESFFKRTVKLPKMYFFDTGLAAYLCGIDNAETLQRSFLKGRFFETFVYNEIRKSFTNEGIMQPLYYYRDSDQNEVDLVLIKDGTLSCIEIKSGQNFNVSDTKGFKKLSNTKYNLAKNAIICTADKVSTLMTAHFC